MRLYFFNLRQRNFFVEDNEGSQHPSLQKAYEHAMQVVTEMVAERMAKGGAIDDEALEICNQQGNVLATIPFNRATDLG